MPVRPILAYPDPRLREAARAVTVFDDTLRALAADLVDTLRDAQALGITAVHVGVPLQVAVIQTDGPDSLRICVNPRVVQASSETALAEEGSVSMPGVTGMVERPVRIEVAWQDLDGQPQAESAEGLLAVCHLHEIDQLAGIFWLDRLSRLKRDRVLQRYRKRP